MRKEIKAVAFDIDGTLYANWRLYILIWPHFLKNIRFFIAYQKVRSVLHRTAPLADFFEYQARLLAERIKTAPHEAKNLIDMHIYSGLKKYFARVKPFPHVEETFKKLKAAGCKIGILSDFPPEQKGDLWGLKKYCDVILGSESCGALKPSIYSFGQLVDALDTPPEHILYVGNSISADIIGAKNAGMQTAYLKPLFSFFSCRKAAADISFRNYRQLQRFMLQ
ncbi:MAG: HAD family hydrolase [Bacteroides sp.]|nr:HAD family hydrolase [Prevotella sp.]MCM1408863.1 HAD family hydrolase [Treponema brennaborense]MCM1470777.1 HAD family hydrolase [Bacteroides sp.]